MVGELESKGMTSRADRQAVRYRMLLKLTDLGHEAADLVEQRAIRAVEEAGTGMTEVQRGMLYSALDLIADNLQIICAEGLK